MKVIGLVSESRYLVEVEHSEIEKVLGKYYGGLPKLKVGEQINAGEAHDYSAAISSVCREMTDAMKRFGSAQETMRRFAEMVAKMEQPAAEQKQPEGGDK